MKIITLLFSLLLLSSAAVSQGLCDGCEWYYSQVSKDSSVSSYTVEKAPGSIDPSGWCVFGWDEDGYEECTTDIGCSGTLILTVNITGLNIGEWINTRWASAGGVAWITDEVKYGEQLAPYTHVASGSVSGDCGSEMADVRVELANRQMGQAKRVLLHIKIFCGACYVAL